MAFESMLWNTTGTGHGPAGGYTQAQWIDYHRYLWTPDTEASAFVLPRKGNQLAVTPGASKVTVDTGAAIAYGFFFKNTAAADVTITTPLLGTTGLIVVLRATWATQLVVPAVVRNSDGVAAIPSATQTPNTTYEVVLAEGTITTGGLVTLTDRRGYLMPALEVIAAMIVNNAVGNAALRDSAALSVIGRSANTTGDPADIAAGTDGYVLRRSGTTLDFGQVATAGIANDAVDDTKAGNRVLRLDRRKGGHPTNWFATGTTDYTPTTVRSQAGMCTTSTGGVVTVNFPTAFSDVPLVTIGGTNAFAMVGITNVTASSFTIEARDVTGARVGINVMWHAEGPE